MTNIVNLRQFKKRQNRAVKEQTARENRVLFGRTKAEKEKAKLEEKSTERFFDQHQRETPISSKNTLSPVAQNSTEEN